MGRKLPVRPIPFPDESPAGYLIRVAEGNGFPSVTAMVDGLCISVADGGWITAAYTRVRRSFRPFAVPFAHANVGRILRADHRLRQTVRRLTGG